MSGQNLRLLKINQTIDELITARIEGLDKVLCESGEDEHINEIISMLINHISRNYEGLFVDHCCMNLVQAMCWWKETYDPNLSLSIEENVEE